jgi:16S rRNA C967 or C1407 C5-methylase (RsmB/RsmF family)/NOL1/NOP2/fmu family ribosome biogenesis protein
VRKSISPIFLDRLNKDIPSLGKIFSILANESPFKAIRIHPNKRPPESFLHDKKRVYWCPLGFEINEKIGNHPFHHAGMFYIQEPSAMAVVEHMNIQPTDVVLDCSAAPGGKSTHIASYLGEQGFLWSHDVDTQRAKQLAFNLERMGFWNGLVSTGPINTLTGLNETFDKILVDAPCSGEGMFRKDDDARSQWNEQLVHHCAMMQKDLLESMVGLVKPGGHIIYSTCTFSKEENELQISEFLIRHPNFSLVKDHFLNTFNRETTHGVGAKILPNEVRGEGHYLVKLRKEGNSIATQWPSSKSTNNSSGHHQLSQIRVIVPAHTELRKVGDVVYLIRHSLPTKGIQLVREGLRLGTIQSYGFVPDHALSHALNVQKPMIELTLEDPRLMAYLKGETIHVETTDGWYVVCVEGQGLGWIKAVKGIGKNHYPKGIRLLSHYSQEN